FLAPYLLFPLSFARRASGAVSCGPSCLVKLQKSVMDVQDERYFLYYGFRLATGRVLLRICIILI
ncbi:hypothetical protein, partial [Alistipes finegoldii]|uniref:hypothetical protein n=1 Tax=Alistipes finegoldii TaxID=214856 RepID=UPI003AAAF163